jgi:predicted metal-dependent enzyme (double-stranded beta helix superfamily)
LNEQGDAPLVTFPVDIARLLEPVDVQPFSPELAARFAELLPTRRMLSAAELEVLVQDTAERDDLWRPLTIADPVRRRYELLYENEHLDVWVLSWMPGQKTGFHDHDISAVGLICVQGELEEGQLTIGCAPSSIRMTRGVSRKGPGGYIHSVSHVAGEPAVSLHAYSPPLMRVGQYRVDGVGRLRREPEHGRRELQDGTIALRGAPVSASR